MIAPGSGLRIVVACRPVDFRKGINGLAALVAEALQADPYCGDVFVFRARRSDRLKILAWDGTGMVLVTKWLEEGGFTWPAVRDGALVLSPAQFALLFAGIDWTRIMQGSVRRPLQVAYIYRYAGQCRTFRLSSCMAINLDQLPRDPAGLVRRIVDLDAEIERLSGLVSAFRTLLFGPRSERQPSPVS